MSCQGRVTAAFALLWAELVSSTGIAVGRPRFRPPSYGDALFRPQNCSSPEARLIVGCRIGNRTGREQAWSLQASPCQWNAGCHGAKVSILARRRNGRPDSPLE